LGSTASQGTGFFSFSFIFLTSMLVYATDALEYPGDFCKLFLWPLHPDICCDKLIGSTLPLCLEVIPLSYFYGHLARVLHWCTHQSITNALEKMELTAAQGQIMGYLAHTKEPPCPRDIEEQFQLSHPTVSGLLSRLEQKGFISLQPDSNDRRCKRIHILSKGWECHDLMHHTIAENEQRMVQDFTPEEQEQFAALLQRAIINMGGNPCHPRHKEEDTK